MHFQLDDAFRNLFVYRYLPLFPLWIAFGLEYSAWIFLMMPVGAGLAWIRSRNPRNCVRGGGE